MKNEKRWICSVDLFSLVKEQLKNDRLAMFTITGMSMWPLMCHGRDQVVVESIKDTLSKGDIVLISIEDKKFILHRVTRIKHDFVETTGDGNFFRDGYFPKAYVMAKVTKIIRNNKEINCNNLLYKIYVWFWMFLFPIRRYIFGMWFKIRKFFR